MMITLSSRELAAAASIRYIYHAIVWALSCLVDKCITGTGRIRSLSKLYIACRRQHGPAAACYIYQSTLRIPGTQDDNSIMEVYQ
jgi:hypothetical protein